MVADISMEYASCLADLENGIHPHARFQRILEICKGKEEGPSRSLPEWLLGAETKCFADSEEMMTLLCEVVVEWYNTYKNNIQIVTPEAVLAKNGRQVLEKHLPRHVSKVDFIYVKANGECEFNTLGENILLLCPGRYQSMQLAGISQKIEAKPGILLLDPDAVENLRQSILENDIKQLEFLFARWEIEAQEGLKKLRLNELVGHCRAILRGDCVER